MNISEMMLFNTEFSLELDLEDNESLQPHADSLEEALELIDGE